VVAGLVARIQRHRRFDLLLEAFAAARARAPQLRLVLVGRGTHQAELVEEPIRRLGLERQVVLAGYREGARYDALLSGLDLGLFLVPGSDGSCRAARELAAAGLALIVSPRPPLPEIVTPGRNGLVVEESVAALSGALVELASDRQRLKALGEGSRRLAEQSFSLARQASRIEGIYERLRALHDGARP
jgi:glycosyltransferase involved in cell wall biosynthesis